MEDDELTKLAVAQLIAEGEKFAKKRELNYTFEDSERLKPNLRYFKSTLNNCVSSNNRKDNLIKSNAAKKLQHLERTKRRERNSLDNIKSDYSNFKDSSSKRYSKRKSPSSSDDDAEQPKQSRRKN